MSAISDASGYEASAEWLQRLQLNPIQAANAVSEWWEIAVELLLAVEEKEKPDIPADFHGLTNLVVMWCDSETHGIDPTPIREYCNQLSARTAKTHGGVRPLFWEPYQAMEATLKKAMLVKDRLETWAENANFEKQRRRKSPADTTERARPGRPKNENIAKRNLRIKQLCAQHKLFGQWVELANVANADTQIQDLKLESDVNHNIARNVMIPPEKRGSNSAQ